MAAPMGPEGCADVLLAHVRTWVPPILVRLGDLYGQVELGPATGPSRPAALEPRGYFGSDRDRVEPTDLPALLVVPQATAPGELVDVAHDSAKTYRWRYTVRVWTAVVHADYDETAAAVRRLTLAVRLAFQTRPQLSATHSVAEGSIRESYSDVARVQSRAGNRTRAQSWVELTLVALETTPAVLPAGPNIDRLLLDVEVVG